MKKTINLFMWGYQQHFRWNVEYRAKELFKLIGVDLQPDVFLIGLARPDRSPRHPVCIEPEDDRRGISPFEGLPMEVERAIEAHPLQDIFYGDEPSMRDKPENIRRMCISECIENAVSLLENGRGFQTFCSSAYPVDDYYVVVVMQIPQEILHKFPTVSYGWQSYTGETSFILCCVSQLLAEARRVLAMPDPGRGISDWEMRSPTE